MAHWPPLQRQSSLQTARSQLRRCCTLSVLSRCNHCLYCRPSPLPAAICWPCCPRLLLLSCSPPSPPPAEIGRWAAPIIARKPEAGGTWQKPANAAKFDSRRPTLGMRSVSSTAAGTGTDFMAPVSMKTSRSSAIASAAKRSGVHWHAYRCMCWHAYHCTCCCDF